MRSATRLFAAVVLTASAAAAMAQDLPQTQAASSSKSRAEVLADLEMFQRAGLGYLPSPTGYIESEQSAEYRNAKAEYDRLLASPAYTAAVAKYESGSASRLAAK